MSFEKDRLSIRLSLKPEATEQVFSIISEIDAVKNSWRIAGKLLSQTIERLTHSVIVTSTGASNRIEGNKLTDAQVEALYKNLRIRKFKTRDEQEVAGYLEMLELVFESYKDIPLKESMILQLHRDMLKYSDKDERHRGQYKFGPNRVEAKDQSGKVVGILFDPTPPHLTPKEMQELIEWYTQAKTKNLKHPLLLIANFVFEYLAIHPFQDGNGRTKAYSHVCYQCQTPDLHPGPLYPDISNIILIAGANSTLAANAGAATSPNRLKIASIALMLPSTMAFLNSFIATACNTGIVVFSPFKSVAVISRSAISRKKVFRRFPDGAPPRLVGWPEPNLLPFFKLAKLFACIGLFPAVWAEYPS